MKKKIILLLIVGILLVISGGYYLFVPGIGSCRLGGGEWREMPDACGGSCSSRVADEVCAQVPTFTCDCGMNKCWNGYKCVGEKK